MPFVPLTPEEKRKLQDSCSYFDHNPPVTYTDIREPVKWVCPACSKETIVYPNGIVLGRTL